MFIFLCTLCWLLNNGTLSWLFFIIKIYNWLTFFLLQDHTTTIHFPYRNTQNLFQTSANGFLILYFFQRMKLNNFSRYIFWFCFFLFTIEDETRLQQTNKKPTRRGKFHLIEFPFFFSHFYFGSLKSFFSLSFSFYFISYLVLLVLQRW